MGLIISVFCACLYCMERSLTWMVCSAVLLTIMFTAFMLAMYGITVGYHMAQKKMYVKMEDLTAENDVDHDPAAYLGSLHRLKRRLDESSLEEYNKKMEHLSDTIKLISSRPPMTVESSQPRMENLSEDLKKNLQENLTHILGLGFNSTNRTSLLPIVPEQDQSVMQKIFDLFRDVKKDIDTTTTSIQNLSNELEEEDEYLETKETDVRKIQDNEYHLTSDALVTPITIENEKASVMKTLLEQLGNLHKYRKEISSW